MMRTNLTKSPTPITKIATEELLGTTLNTKSNTNLNLTELVSKSVYLTGEKPSKISSEQGIKSIKVKTKEAATKIVNNYPTICKAVLIAAMMGIVLVCGAVVAVGIMFSPSIFISLLLIPIAVLGSDAAYITIKPFMKYLGQVEKEKALNNALRKLMDSVCARDPNQELTQQEKNKLLRQIKKVEKKLELASVKQTNQQQDVFCHNARFKGIMTPLEFKACEERLRKQVLPDFFSMACES